MSITTIFIYLIYSLILFLVLEYMGHQNKTSDVNKIVVSLIYLIVISGLSPDRTYNIFLVIILELIVRMFYIHYVLEKDFLKLDNNYLKRYLITIILSYVLNVVFINQIDSVFPTVEQMRIIIWLAIIIFLYATLRGNVIVSDDSSVESVFRDNGKYIIIQYAKLKDQYFNVINTKYIDLVPVVYAIMVYHCYYKPTIVRKLDMIKFRMDNEERQLGIMQIKTKKFITDEESIELCIKKLEKIYAKLSSRKGIKKESLPCMVIKEYMKKEGNFEDVVDIYNKIIEFDKK